MLDDHHAHDDDWFDPRAYLPPAVAAGDDLSVAPPISALDELRAIPHWVSWKYFHRPGAPKPTKPPVDPNTGGPGNHSDPKTWAAYEKACWRTRFSRLAGVGFVLTDGDGLTGIDLDACRNVETGELEPWAAEIIELGETYAEVSPSGTGIRLLARGKVASATKCDPAHVEIYGSHRYLTITGNHIDETPEDIRPAPQTIERLLARVVAFAPAPTPERKPAVIRAAEKSAGDGKSFFRAVNERALANLDLWVTAIFPSAKQQSGTGAFRVTSKSLGRPLQEDIGFVPTGIVDFGVADMGDPNQGKRRPIDIVLEWGGAKDVTAAAKWLCDKLGVTPEALGWRDEQAEVEALAAQLGRSLVEDEDGTLHDPETGEVFERPATNVAARARKPIELEAINAATFAGQDVPEQLWLVDNLIPHANVTLLSGDGATGKSLLALQLGVATATAGDWLGLKPHPGRVVFVSAEDELDELHRRLARMTPRLENLGWLTIVPLAGRDAVMAAPMGREGLLQPTPIFAALRRIVETHGPDLLILDTLADLFGGDEIKKVHARQFISLLRGMAFEFGVTVLLLSHPSQAGLNSGSGMSGNTAWNNSVRSRLYFERRINKYDGSEDDIDIRVLTTKKSNRAASGGKIVVRYSNGVFIRENGCNFEAADRGHHADRVFMSLIAQFEREGRNVSDKPSSAFAPVVFARHPNSEGLNKGDFEKAMNRLFEVGRIKVEETGPPSRRTRKIAVSDRPEERADDGDGGSDGHS